MDKRKIITTTTNAISERLVHPACGIAEMKLHYKSGGTFPMIIGGEWDKGERMATWEYSGFGADLRHYIRTGAWPEDSENTRVLLKKHGRKRTLLRRQEWAAMYEDIKRNGYTVRESKSRTDKYITVEAGRDGKLFFRNGIHRYCCIVESGRGSDPLPVEVLVQHADWSW